MNGTIIRLMIDKGFGFILSTEDKKQYFFHKDDFDGFFDELTTGSKVTFDVVSSLKGPRAGQVRVE